jgi:hypothetical protein
MSTTDSQKPEAPKTEDKSSRSATKTKADTDNKTSTVDIAALAVKEESQSAPIAHKGSLTVTDTIHHYGDRPIVDGGFRAFEYFNSSGERPIEASKLVVSGTYTTMGAERPIVSNGVHVIGTFMSSGERPVVEDGFKIVSKFYTAGERPVGSSGLVVSDTYSQMGGTRPVASNAIDQVGLMGFID